MYIDTKNELYPNKFSSGEKGSRDPIQPSKKILLGIMGLSEQKTDQDGGSNKRRTEWI